MALQKIKFQTNIPVEIVVDGGKSTRRPHEAWITVDPHGTVRVLMTGPDSV